jgi:uncharacterized protein (UPF0305 family)
MVATSTSKETWNTIRFSFTPIACWKMEDICFEFDRAFVKQNAKNAFKSLAELRKKHPLAPISIFGHADPVGKDQYNKKLSENRAMAVYSILIRDVAKWKKIFKDDAKYLGPKTQKSVIEYMDGLCGDLRLKESDFLGSGNCAFQGCSEFNPVLMFSKKEWEDFEKAKDKNERNMENQPNRRVVAFLFLPKTNVDPKWWPCPTAKEGIKKCEKRFWSDWGKRRSYQKKRRYYKDERRNETQDTFACRFYERIAHLSPCESARVFGFHIAFIGKLPYRAQLEIEEINKGAPTRIYLNEDLRISYDELRDQDRHAKRKSKEHENALKFAWETNFNEYKTFWQSAVAAIVIVEFKTLTSGKEVNKDGKRNITYQVTARVMDPDKKILYFKDKIKKKSLIGKGGYWYLSSDAKGKNWVWRQVPRGKKPSDFKHTKFVNSPDDIYEAMKELHKKLRYDKKLRRLYDNITHRLIELLRKQNEFFKA